MRSKQLFLERYPTDKHYFNDLNQFMEEYDQVLEPWVNEKIKLLELGIHSGGSLLLWKDYFSMDLLLELILLFQRTSPRKNAYTSLRAARQIPGF